ncbi:TonB-dependent hemoglobin/transferrin/lactoferrin family receptor [Orrella marina]|uniref:TonB-dependent receptor n=1 Tax=Orrella marina TaxID=2163011 RepID=A0A2R4XFA3_9BURK|nr:TonB-dependent hemoglobin/transferrin/lactoferrin family receptor [Orrella marina]AWB32480.1 TonB-dependent receptor [Orrella marina]
MKNHEQSIADESEPASEGINEAENSSLSLEGVTVPERQSDAAWAEGARKANPVLRIIAGDDQPAANALKLHPLASWLAFGVLLAAAVPAPSHAKMPAPSQSYFATAERSHVPVTRRNAARPPVRPSPVRSSGTSGSTARRRQVAIAALAETGFVSDGERQGVGDPNDQGPVTDTAPSGAMTESPRDAEGVKGTDEQVLASGVFSPIKVVASPLDDEPWTTVIGRERLDQWQVQDWNQLANRVDAGVNFNATDGSINIRGLDKNRVLTRIDGVRQSWLSDIRYGYGTSVRGGLSSLDFNAVSDITIQRGVDSAAAGSGAMAGLVDVRTLEPEDLLAKPRSRGGVAALIKTGMQSVDSSWLVNAALAGHVTDDLTWMLQAGGQFGHETHNRGTEGGYGVTRSQANPANYSLQNYILKLRQKFEGGHRLGLSGTYFERQDDRTDLSASLTYYYPGQVFTSDTVKRKAIALDYNWDDPAGTGILDSVALNAYWQQADLETQLDGNRIKSYARGRLKYPFGPYGRHSSMQETTLSAQGVVVKSLQSAALRQRWEAGVQWYGTRLTQFAGASDNCPEPVARSCPFIKANQADMPNSKGNQWGLWLQNRMTFGQFEVTPTLRYDYYQQRPQNTSDFVANPAHVPLPDSSGAAWSPKVLVAWSPLPDFSVYAQYAKGFTAPTATQLFSRYGTPQTYLYKGNPHLKAETSHGWETGVRYESARAGAALTYFDNHYSNFIQQVVVAGMDFRRPSYPMLIQGFDNLESVRIYGVEAGGHWNFARGWRLSGSLAWAVGKDLGTDRYLNSVAPLTAMLGVSYSQDTWGVAAQIKAATSRSNVAYPTKGPQGQGPDFQAPGYGIVDVTAYWSPAEVKGLTIRAGVYNLFNKTYWNALDVPSGAGRGMSRPVDLYTQPGINYGLTVTYRY